MRIGFIGLGNMGGPMALNLIKAGHALVVHDVRSELAKAYLERGAKAADNPRGAAQGAELILTSLPGPAEVESVALGERGVIHGAAKNRSEEHTSELQSLAYLVCRLLLEKKKNKEDNSLVR